MPTRVYCLHKQHYLLFYTPQCLQTTGWLRKSYREETCEYLSIDALSMYWFVKFDIIYKQYTFWETVNEHFVKNKDICTEGSNQALDQQNFTESKAMQQWTSAQVTEKALRKVWWFHDSWWRHQMEIFSALLAFCAGNSPVTGEFPAQRLVTRSFDIVFDLRLNKRLSKQPQGWWFETRLYPLCPHCNVFLEEHILENAHSNTLSKY